MHEVTLPKLSNTMEMGQIAGWRIREGDPVAKGEVIAEIETDKAMVEMESPEEGVLLKIVHGEGAEVEVGTVIAYIGTAGEVPPTEEKAPTAGKAPVPAAAPQAAKPEAPGKWSTRHVIQHLADSDLVWGYRIRMVLAHDRPRLAGYDQDLWAERLRYERVAAGQALNDFSVLRESNLRLLARVPAGDLERVAVHAERAPLADELEVIREA